MCVGNDLCYEENSEIENFLNTPAIRETLGVTSPRNFSSVAWDVNAGFAAHMDSWRVPTQQYVAELLTRGVHILIYAGTYDWQCNWVANKLWVEKLQWSGHDSFNEQEWRVWGLNKTIGAGITKSSGPLTFATVWGAGHMVNSLLFFSWKNLIKTYFKVPFDKPAEAFALVSRWVAGELL